MKSASTHLRQIFLCLFLTFSLASCRTSIDIGAEDGNGNITKETRTITEKFDKISVSTGIKVIVKQNNNTAVTVETDENIQPLIITKVENGVLVIKAKDAYNTDKSPEVSVNMPFVSGLESSSGASIVSSGVLKSASLSVDSSSGSDINIDVEADYISLDSSSGSTIKASGKALKADTSSSSGSTINASGLMANDVFAQTSSGSTSKVYPIVSLNAKASSGSSLLYKNVPEKLQKSESSGGNVSNR